MSKLAIVMAMTALLATGANAQDRPDLMDLSVSSTGVGGSAPLVDDGKGKPLSGVANRVGFAELDNSTTLFASGTLTGMVADTFFGGTTVQLFWFTNEPDRVQRGAKNGRIDQKAFLAFGARILTPDGYTAYTGATASQGVLFFGYDTISDCSAKFSARGVPTPADTAAPTPDSAKWSAKCKQSTVASILTAIGVPAVNQTTILDGLGIDGADKYKMKGGFK